MPRTPTSSAWRHTFKEWLPAILVMIAAMLIRAWNTASPEHFLLAGADGPYLPLQVRSILEHGRLAFSDMPGLFWIDAALAWVIRFLTGNDVEHSVLLAVRAFDILLPPLAAIPVFLIGREFRSPASDDRWNWLTLAYAVLGFTPLVVFSYQLQKNALGVVWMFTVLLFIIRFMRSRRPIHLAWAVVALMGCAITHFGTVTITLLLATIMLVLDARGYAERKALLSGKRVLSILFSLCLVMGLIASFDPQRSWRLLQMPLQVFDAPVILFTLRGEGPLQGWTLITVILSHLLSLSAIAILVKYSKVIPETERSIAWAMVVGVLILSSPLLGLEWANRFFLVAYVPQAILWMILFRTPASVWLKRAAGLLLTFPLAFSLMSACFSRPPRSIDGSSHAAFVDLQKEVGIGPKDVVVARQDLQLLANWTFHSRGIARHLLTKKDMAEYGQVYIIRQLRGKSPALRSLEPGLFPDERAVFRNEHFKVTVKSTDKGLPESPGTLFRGFRGEVYELNDQEMIVKDDRTHKVRYVVVRWPAVFDPSSLLGRHVEVDGLWIPMSIRIRATRVTILE